MPGLFEVRRHAVIVCSAVAVALVAAQPATAQTTPAPPAAPAQSVDPASRLAALDAATVALAEEITAAQTELGTRRAALAAANAAASDASAASFSARVDAAAARTKVDDLVRAGYSGARTSRLSAMLVSQSPQELLDRMTVLDLLGTDSARALGVATAAAATAERAEATAATARATAAAAEAQALTVQTGLVQRRRELQTQTAEANALLAQLTASQAAAAGSARGLRPATVVAPDQLAASQQASAVRASRATATRNSLFVAPVQGTVTSPYGARDGGMHQGVDIANRIGTPIVAIADGVVIDSGPAAGFGLWVRIRHSDGTITLYGHNDRNTVTVGQQVSAGEQIAAVGNRGQSTGAHVHVEVQLPGGSNTDPIAWLAGRGVAV